MSTSERHGGAKLHDYVRGAFEALTWVQRLLQTDAKKNPTEQLSKLDGEVEAAIADIKDGVAENFRWKLRDR